MNEITTPPALVAIDCARYAEHIALEYHAFEDAGRKAMEHARRAGAMLSEVKRHLPHGSFSKWVDENFPGSNRTAQRFIKIANSWETIEANTPRAADLSLRQAEQMLTELRRADDLARHEQVIEDGIKAIRVIGKINMAEAMKFKRELLEKYSMDPVLVGLVFDLAGIENGGAE